MYSFTFTVYRNIMMNHLESHSDVQWGDQAKCHTYKYLYVLSSWIWHIYGDTNEPGRGYMSQSPKRPLQHWDFKQQPSDDELCTLDIITMTIADALAWREIYIILIFMKPVSCSLSGVVQKPMTAGSLTHHNVTMEFDRINEYIPTRSLCYYVDYMV